MKKNIFWIITFFLVMFASVFIVIFISEITFYIVNDKWYFYQTIIFDNSDKSQDMLLYRDRFPIKKGNRIRVVTIGGSTTYGFGVNSHMTWPKQLEDTLERHYEGKYEIINLGMLGGHLKKFTQNYYASSNTYISREEWLRGERSKKNELAQWGWKLLQPDIILLVPIVNDTAPDYLYSLKPNIIAKLSRSMLNCFDSCKFFKKFVIGYYLRKGLITLELNNLYAFDNQSEKLKIIRSKYKFNLSKFIDLWDKKVKIYLFGFPLLFNKHDSKGQVKLASDYWNISDLDSILRQAKYLPILEIMEMDVRKEISREKKIFYKEIGGNIKKLSFPNRLRLYMDSIHMNAEGLKMLSDEIYQFVFQEEK